MAFKEYGSYDGVGLADLVRKKQVTPKELLEYGERWRPHRTLASLYLWRSLHNEPE